MNTPVFLGLAGFSLMMKFYLAEAQGITSCTYDPSTCSGDTNLGRINLKNASLNYPYSMYDYLNYYYYYWDPCKDFTIDWVTAGAIQSFLSGSAQIIGVHSLAYCDAVNGYAQFNMKTTDNSRTTFVKCICGSGDSFTLNSVFPVNSYNFQFTSSSCCPKAVEEADVTISPGSVMVIIFFTVLVVYLLLGSLFQVFVRKAEGWERVPNISYWSALPGLIKDGFVLTYSQIRRQRYQKM